MKCCTRFLTDALLKNWEQVKVITLVCLAAARGRIETAEGSEACWHGIAESAFDKKSRAGISESRPARQEDLGTGGRER